jgi:hypothetical protein
MLHPADQLTGYMGRGLAPTTTITFAILSFNFWRCFFQTMRPAAPNLPAPRTIPWETVKFHATIEPFTQFHRNVASRPANTTPSPMFCERSLKSAAYIASHISELNRPIS